MKVLTYRTYYGSLEQFLNRVGIENVLYIIPEHNYDGTLFVVVYKENNNERND